MNKRRNFYTSGFSNYNHQTTLQLASRIIKSLTGFIFSEMRKEYWAIPKNLPAYIPIKKIKKNFAKNNQKKVESKFITGLLFEYKYRQGINSNFTILSYVKIY
jgi:hypothetical protein